ncbi:MAG: hypothetical protein JWN04_1894 [Myxococcaceae bacterium]|nr:hypothetical protein [Myxococcaceae bacterium]
MLTHAEPGTHVIVVALEIRDDALYAAYRARMTPLLEARAGRFGFDFVVSKVLKTSGSLALNRVFSMVFPDRATREAFFADPTYLKARSELFEPAVQTVEFLAEYDQP